MPTATTRKRTPRTTPKGSVAPVTEPTTEPAHPASDDTASEATAGAEVATLDLTAEETDAKLAEVLKLADSVADDLVRLSILLYELRDRRGWKAKGYTSWVKFCAAELPFTKRRADQRAFYGGKVLELLASGVAVEDLPSEKAVRNGGNPGSQSDDDITNPDVPPSRDELEPHQVWVWMGGAETPHWEVRGTGAVVSDDDDIVDAVVVPERPAKAGKPKVTVTEHDSTTPSRPRRSDRLARKLQNAINTSCEAFATLATFDGFGDNDVLPPLTDRRQMIADLKAIIASARAVSATLNTLRNIPGDADK